MDSTAPANAVPANTVPTNKVPEGPKRGALTALGLLALVATAVLGGNLFGLRERVLGPATPQARPAAASRSADPSTPADAKVEETVLRSQPWWQSLGTFEGTGPMTTPAFTVTDDAIQWRVTWTCDQGNLVVRAGSEPEPMVDATCPGNDVSYSTETGPTTLQVATDGHWQLQVEQQVDVPLLEPPLPAMTAPGATATATGSLYRIDQVGKGDLTIYRLDDGTHALRLDDFFVTPNVDFEVRLSPLEAPRTTKEFMDSPSVWVAPLDVTAGSLNFVIPKEVDPTQYRSVVIWCPLIDSAYAAASLTPGQ